MIFFVVAYEAATETKIYSQLQVRMPRRRGCGSFADAAIKKVIDGPYSHDTVLGRQQLKTTKSGVQVRATAATASADEVHRLAFRNIDSNQGALVDMCEVELQSDLTKSRWGEISVP